MASEQDMVTENAGAQVAAAEAQAEPATEARAPEPTEGRPARCRIVARALAR